MVVVGTSVCFLCCIGDNLVLVHWENERILLFVRLNSVEHKSASVDLSSDRQGFPAQMR